MRRALPLVLALALAACQRDALIGNALSDARLDGAAPRAPFVRTAGGEGADAARAIALDGEGNIYVAGSFSGTARFGEHALLAMHAHESFVAKLDPRGAFQWVVAVGGTANDKPQALAIDREGKPRPLPSSAAT